ncbi:HNH endonuclease [Mycobacterium phage Weirdo19]|uniref:HNH endonuclease n=1 Tax=Mycobacterium phage Weirdo19 TaxID=2601610 RepID=A0A6M2YSY0_9CAUD|nr:HNH endonuclease [Mycobacterium phage Weirdo19]QEA10846.1 HNH endonuclease [Mycobacterium phage Weirdo19]
MHGTAGNHADRLMHDICNKQRGDGTRDDQRPALNPELVAELDAARGGLADLGDLGYFDWPAG